MKNLVFILLTLLSATSAQAASQEIERETLGFGNTYQEALSSALLEAIRQVNGIDVGTEKRLKTTLSKSIGLGEITINQEKNIAIEIYSQSQGRVKSYKIVEVTPPKKAAEQWQVKALVTVPIYEAAIPNDNRKTIAVFPFEIASNDVTTTKIQITTNNLSSRLSDGILSELVQSGKFSVINRAYQSQFNQELALLKTTKVSPTEASRLGQKLGADFMLVGKIYSVHENDANTGFYGSKPLTLETEANLSYSLIEASTEKVIWADTLDYKYPGKNDDDDYVSNFISGLAGSIATAILDTSHPVKVLDLQSDKKVLLDQGGKRFKVGLLMDVFSQGDKQIDPISKIATTVDGQKVAQIEIVDIRANYTIARIVSGTYAEIQIGAIVRQAKETPDKGIVPARELTPGSSDKPWNWD